MNKAFIALTLGAVLGISAAGQAQKTDFDTAPAPTKSKSVKQDSQSAAANNADTPVLAAGTALEAQLQGVVDVRKGQVGDQVILKTTKAVKQNGEVIVPKGTKLMGRITEVQRKTKDSAISRVGMVFDRIQGKELDAPINLSIVSVAAATANAGAGDVFSGDISGSGSSSTTASGSSSSGGGLLGSVAPAVGGVVGGAAQTVGSVASGTTQRVSRTTGLIGNTVGGLTVANSISGSASSASTVSAQGKDVRIEK
jgi:hypothetical protein